MSIGKLQKYQIDNFKLIEFLTRAYIFHDDSHAAPRSPVHLLSLLAVVVPAKICLIISQNESVYRWFLGIITLIYWGSEIFAVWHESWPDSVDVLLVELFCADVRLGELAAEVPDNKISFWLL